MLLLLLTLITIFHIIPNEFHDLVKEAKRNSKIHLMSNEKNIYYAGTYFFKYFNFKLSSPIICHGANNNFYFAFNNSKKVVAIICRNSSNTQKNTILSTSQTPKFLKLGDKIAEVGNISIVKYEDIDPFSIFSDFHFANYDYIPDNQVQFSRIFKPIKSYNGNDIYKQYALNTNCSVFQNSSGYCRGLVNNNFKPIEAGTNISQMIPKENILEFYDDDNHKKSFETYIGGVFGLFAGVDIRYTNPSDLKIQLFQATEAETHVKFILPPGKYTNKSIVLNEETIEIFKSQFNIFDCEYSVTVNGKSSISVQNITFDTNENLMFNQRAGIKSQKEFQIHNNKSFNIYKSSELISYELFKTDIEPPSKDFHGKDLELNIVISTGLEVVLKSIVNGNENDFSIKSAVKFKREINASHNSTICPCPYLLGRNSDVGLFDLETKSPFIKDNSVITSAKKFFKDELFWSKKNPNSWCQGGNLYTYDENIEQKNPDSAVLTINHVRYGTEYKNKSNSYYNLIASIYDYEYNLIEDIFICQFQFSYQSIADGSETKLNYISFINNITNSAYISFSCFDSNGIIFNDTQNYHLIKNGLNEEVTLESKKGTPIIAFISIKSCVLCNFETQTNISRTCSYASVKPNLFYDSSIGLITHEIGSYYDVLTTSINDQYSSEIINDCFYDIKNIWNVKILSFETKIPYKYIIINILKKNEASTETILSINITNNNIKDISKIIKFFEICKLDDSLQMRIYILKYNCMVISDLYNINHSFFSKESNTVIIESNKTNIWKCQIQFNPYSYPVIFDINLVKSGTTLIFASAYKANTPFSQKIKNGSPSTIRIECPKSFPQDRYGIFKLEFEFDIKSFYQIEANEITVLIIMKNLKPICSYKKIDDDLYSMKISKEEIKLYYTGNGSIYYYPIPFRYIEDSSEIFSIQVVDVFLSSISSDEICDFNDQIVSNGYFFIHNACIAKDDDVEKIESLSFYCDINITQYTYPQKNDVVQNWRLLGYSFESNNSNQAVPHLIIIQSEIEFPKNNYILTIYGNNKDLLINCPRCRALRVNWKRNNEEKWEYFYNNSNHRFLIHTIPEWRYHIYAVCKNDQEKHCEKSLYGKNDFSLISVPAIGYIHDEYSYLGLSYKKFNSNMYTQFVYDRKNVTYITGLKSKIQKIKTFIQKLQIRIAVKYSGYYKIISAFETTSNNVIPLAQEDEIFNLLSIKSTGDHLEYYYISGSIFLYGNTDINFKGYMDISKASILFDLPEKFTYKFDSIFVDNQYNDNKKNFNENSFCFYQSNDINCKNSEGIQLKYPEFNNFMILADKSNKSIRINVQEDLNFLYPNFGHDIENLTVIFLCSSMKHIKGEIVIPPGMKIVFIGKFNLTELYITTIVNWENEMAGVMSFENIISYPQIDVQIEDNPIHQVEYLELVSNGDPKLNLLNKYDPENKFEFKIYQNKIYCLTRITEFPQKNEFCIYQENPTSCISKCRIMNSISTEDLNIFPNYFDGNYNNVIIFHLAENVSFTDETLKSFFDNHPNIVLQIQSINKLVVLSGVFKCPKDVTLLFDEDDYLSINNLTIDKNVSILNRMTSIEVGYIDLCYKEVKSINLYFEDFPGNINIDTCSELPVIKKCEKNINVNIPINTYSTEYLNTIIYSKIYNNEYKIFLSTEVNCNISNLFCIYENNPCSFKDGHPIKSSEIDKIAKYIDTENTNLTLQISEDVNIDLDISNIKIIKFVLIDCLNTQHKFSGKIKLYEKTEAFLNNLDIEDLTIDVDVAVSNNLSSCYDISNCNGMPNVKIYPHLLPTKVEYVLNQTYNSLALIYKKEINIVKDDLQFPMIGGYLHQYLSTEIMNNVKLPIKLTKNVSLRQLIEFFSKKL